MLEWIVTSSLLIFVVLALRLLLRNRLSGRVRYALWGLVLLRLLIPVQLFTAPVSVGDYLPQPDAAALEERTLYVLPVQEIPLEEAEQAGLIQTEEGGLAASDADSSGYARVEGDTVRRYAGKISAADLALWVWGSGCALVLLALLWSNVRFARRLKRLRRPLETGDCPLPVYEAEGLPSPCLFGLFRPAIYITPEAAAEPVVLRHVLAHEITHFHQGDHIWNALRAAALALHWYNPLVWWAAISSKRDGELACDEGAIRRLGEGERQSYGETLLHLLTVRLGPRDLFACATTMSGDKKSLRERFSRISCKRKTLVGVSAAVILVAAAAAVFFFAGNKDLPGGENSSTPDGQIPELALDVVTVEGTEDGGPSEKTVLELPRFLDGDDPVLRDLNARMADVKAHYDTLLSGSDDVSSATLSAYPCLGSNCVSIVMLGKEFPCYGHEGDVTSFCYDFVEGREVTMAEALEASGWTEEEMETDLFHYIRSHISDYYGEGERELLASNLEIVGFRQRMDGGWDFFFQYRRPEGVSSAWHYLFTFSDGAIKRGVAVPTKELLDIGSSFTGLTFYETETWVTALPLDQLIAKLEPEDILSTGIASNDPAAALAALRAAMEHVTDFQGEVRDYWRSTVTVDGSPRSFDSGDLQIELRAGAPEGIVEVYYRDSPFYHRVYVEDEALYALLREAHRRETSVDPVWERYAEWLNARMEAVLRSYQERDRENAGSPEKMARYTGCELLIFQERAVYDDLLPGQTISVYGYSCVLTMERPEYSRGTLDAELRTWNGDDLTFFAAVQDGEGNVTDTRFFAPGLFLGDSDEEIQQNARETLLAAFTGGEA